MKHLFSISIFLVIMVLAGCNSSDKPNTSETYEYVEETVELNDFLKQKIGDWAEKGVTCYGLVVLQDADGNLLYGLPVKAKIVSIKSDRLRMKALGNINLSGYEGCNKIGISYGDKWWETEGDIFKTKEEAEAYLKKNNLEMK